MNPLSERAKATVTEAPGRYAMFVSRPAVVAKSGARPGACGGSVWLSMLRSGSGVGSAIGYARELGFEPHADFAPAAEYLGAWDGECELAFGRDGKPMYISGPYDDGARILRKLHRGPGNETTTSCT